ncbi:OLC1v1025262C1 [Oldenlandia corymbosa var. corymbosa]|uniref:OLC1v1025262C1 n=1 Tax=Oldenlandia corymbosa var. corymbosa TaxID=529605 RepID=A0AAV1C5R7_OLDCO|nr:OLC1v1025262C1 [Oldenlandia corymbosa var. corymbosa]
MATNLSKKLITTFIILLSVSTTQVVSVAPKCEEEEQNSCINKHKAFPLKIIALISILVASMIGVSLPLVTRSIPALGPDRNLFVILKCFAAGIILGTGFMHVLPDSFEMMGSSCLEENPWHKFPFTGFLAMLSAIATLMVDSIATSVYTRKNGSPKEAVIAAKGGPLDQEMGVVDGHAGHFHGHGSSTMKSNAEGSQLLRYRVIAMVLELGIIVHSVVIGLSLGASNNTCTIKGLVAALCFHQMFEGMGLGGCILQAEYGFLKKATAPIDPKKEREREEEGVFVSVLGHILMISQRDHVWDITLNIKKPIPPEFPLAPKTEIWHIIGTKKDISGSVRLLLAEKMYLYQSTITKFYYASSTSIYTSWSTNNHNHDGDKSGVMRLEDGAGGHRNNNVADNQPHFHHHHHGSINTKDNSEGAKLLRYRVISMVLEFGIIVHSVVIGLSLGASNNTCTIKGLVAALCFHQMFEGMGLGGSILQAEYSLVKKSLMAFFFAVTTPFGVALGLALSNTYKESSPHALVTVGLLNASSAGLLIYMALVNLLASDFMGPKLQGSIKLQIKAYFAVLLGAGGMSVMALWA